MKKTITVVALPSSGTSQADKLRDDILRATDESLGGVVVTIDPSTWIEVRCELSRSSPLIYVTDVKGGHEPRLYGARVVVDSSVDGWTISHDNTC